MTLTLTIGGMSKTKVREKFNEHDTNKNGFLEFGEFKKFFKNMMPGCITECSKTGDVRMAKELLEAGADPDERDTNQSTPLIHAVWPGFTEFIHLLVEYGADVNAKNNKNNTAIHFAFEKVVWPLPR